MSEVRAALVTGASKRIGLRIAEVLAANGYAVALHARAEKREDVRATAERLTQGGGATCVVAGDLADPEALATLVPKATAALGPLSLLVNSAGVFQSDLLADFDRATWDMHFAVNVRAPVLLARDFAAQAVQGGDASIVNIVDQRVLRSTPQFFSYSLSKAALWAATQSMAQALAPKGIRVNAVGPGPVLPNIAQGDAGFAHEVAGVPLRRQVSPDEIAAAVLYLAEARSVTGQLIAVDAGQHLAWETPDIVP